MPAGWRTALQSHEQGRQDRPEADSGRRADGLPIQGEWRIRKADAVAFVDRARFQV
jgi:hypothetical protein